MKGELREEASTGFPVCTYSHFWLGPTTAVAAAFPSHACEVNLVTGASESRRQSGGEQSGGSENERAGTSSDGEGHEGGQPAEGRHRRTQEGLCLAESERLLERDGIKPVATVVD